jgi:hypothetical protein
MRGAFVGVILAFLAAVPAQAAYSGVTGGIANPASIAPGGATDYSVTLTGKAKPVDIVFVIEASGSMATSMGATSRESAVAAATNNEIDSLDAAGLFTRGGTIAVVSFSDSASTGAAPTTDVAALNQAVADIAPSGSGCLSCGIQRATDLLTAIPGSAGHKQIAYLIGDENDNVAPADVATATAASNGAHIERRAIGIPSGPITDLDSTDSAGAAMYAGSTQAVLAAYAADPTSYPGASNLSWVFHLAPGFSPSAPSASIGSASVNDGDVTWTIPSLDATNATLTFHAVHSPAAGCAATALLSGTTFSDAEGDSGPAAGLGPLTVTGCPPASLRITHAAVHGTAIGTGSGVSLTLVLNRPGTVKLRFERKIVGRRVHGRCVAKTRANHRLKSCARFVAAGTLTKALQTGSEQIKLTRSLDGGRKLAPGTYRVLVLAAGARTAAKTFTLKVHG